jgi:hypothetical protein
MVSTSTRRSAMAATASRQSVSSCRARVGLRDQGLCRRVDARGQRRAHAVPLADRDQDADQRRRREGEQGQDAALDA